LAWLRTGRAETDERARNLQDIAIALDTTVGAIERKIKEFVVDPASEARISSSIQHALKCIEATVRLALGTMDDRYCCVTLLTFEAADQVQIRSRSRIERKIGNLVHRDETMAYLAAKYVAEVAVLHHFRHASLIRGTFVLKYRSLSSAGGPKYQSILFLPLPAVPVTGQNPIRKGVVTIDSAKPYAFLGKEIEIAVCIQAYLHLINLMLTGHGVGIEPEA
jgi:hypothetical protein